VDIQTEREGRIRGEHRRPEVDGYRLREGS
jgi:hypothetical protein